MFSMLPRQDDLQDAGHDALTNQRTQEDLMDTTNRKPSPIALFVALLLAGYVPQNLRTLAVSPA